MEILEIQALKWGSGKSSHCCTHKKGKQRISSGQHNVNSLNTDFFMVFKASEINH